MTLTAGEMLETLFDVDMPAGALRGGVADHSGRVVRGDLVALGVRALRARLEGIYE